MAFILLGHGLRAKGVHQYPNQSDSSSTHSHFKGFIVKPFVLSHYIDYMSSFVFIVCLSIGDIRVENLFCFA